MQYVQSLQKTCMYHCGEPAASMHISTCMFLTCSGCANLGGNAGTEGVKNQPTSSCHQSFLVLGP